MGTEIVINKTEKPHSLEIGKAGMRHKIYYDTQEELEEHLKFLREMSLLE